LVYVEAAEESSYDIGRRLHSMKLAGWFADANAILVRARPALSADRQRSTGDAHLVNAYKDAHADAWLNAVAELNAGAGSGG